MTPTLKSYGFSLLLHGTLAAALYLIPASTMQSFSSSRQSQVISIEATQDHSTTHSPVTITAQPTPPTSPLDSLVDRSVSADMIRPTPTVDERSRPPSDRPDLPRMQPLSSVPELQLDQKLELKRRQFQQQPPEMFVAEKPPRPRSPRRVARPPAGAANPMQQFVGLDEKETADMSKNQPPAYPLEAIRRKLEGVVLLRLQITATGMVQDVALIESSGHRLLDQAAIDAVAHWQGRAARRWGRPVESVERLRIRFRL